ncbi:acyl-CoA dehydrogenase [Cryptosporangium aurantiacum]|uniref:Acyl-CoA dehydrogenase n=1 Tax=Cryptosporangium aurantiacum TaxID=134849 RepID=A0A1M7RJT5_9ACTN|nr:acyl-CoA dehydrogenase [Cryptosporangium aurantiacum]SHN46605.1 Acyl-CoA dehydrogenase [Cryptosporangium aurantiacum]
MSIGVTEEQQELSAAVRGFAARHAPVSGTRELFAALAAGERPAHWAALVAQGLHAVHLPEENGGQGGGLAELAVVLEETGRGLLPGPFGPTVLTSAVVSRAPDGAVRTALLDALAGGVTAALVPPGLTAEASDGGWTLSGRSGPVLGLLAADVLVVGAVAGDRTVWLRMDPAADGVRRIVEEGVDLTRDVGRLDLDRTVVPADAELVGVDADAVRYLVTALSAAEAAGTMAWCVAATVEYALVREQFGRPIGSFQAVKHKAARLFVASELAAAAAWDAVRSLDQAADQQRLAVGGAAVVALGRAVDAACEAVTLFGGIGFTWEHDVHLYWRRAMSLAAVTGPTGVWQAELGEAALTSRRSSSVAVTGVDPEFRARVGAVIDAALAHPEDTHRVGVHHTGPRRTHLADAGLIAPHWPAPYGLNATPVQQLVIAEEFARRDVTPPSIVIGDWAMPTILAHGTPEQAERFAAPTLRGEIVWCQLFSEPGAGSDLAGLSTKAVKVDGGWRLDGQKVWNSGAHQADWGICLARTDPDVPKHKGISYFLVDMRSPGVDVRPLRQATGASEFNEVFLNGVFVPDDCLVGAPGEGWRLTITTLGNERTAISATMGSVDEDPIREIITKNLYGGARADAVRALGQVHAYGSAVAALNLRETLRRLAGQQPGAGASVAKVASAQLHRDAADATFALVGPEAAVRGGPVDVARRELGTPAQLIGGGTVEIQLNVIAERVLRLPRG